MSKRAAAALAVFVSLGVCSSASADARNPINGYRVKASSKNLEQLALAGFDVTEGRNARKGTVEVFGSAGQLAKFRRETGIKARLVRDARGRTTAQRSARIARRGQALARTADADPFTGSDAAFKVWTRFDAVPGDGKEQYTEQYDRLDDLSIVKQMAVGPQTHLGRDVIALKVTKNAKTTADGSRPAVLYSAVQHAREWLAGETCRRQLEYFTSNYGKVRQVTRLVDNTELWFICVANPDGYEYTFTPGNRLWRKNMANNDGGPAGGVNDGVDPNRNFPRNWGLDDEGSSSALDSETYRGTGPASEPETQAMIALMNHVDFAFQKNDHTAAQLLLYPQGFQQYTPTADDAIFTALAGDDADPAIKTFDPDLGAELYITNGDTNDYAYRDKDVLSYTPEGTPASDASLTGFEFEDKETAIQAEFKRHLPFALDLAESAAHPDEPSSHLGNTVQDFYIDAFADSFGDPQPVQVTAKRSLGDLELRYRINGGAVKTAGTEEFEGGERYYQDDSVYYHRLRGEVKGTQTGDQVEVWFAQENGSKRSDSFTYSARVESSNPVLIMSAEDYSGVMPNTAPEAGPKYLDAYTAALDANGVGYDVYDVDARGRRAPHPLGVLSHYDAVIWYTGDDYVTREPDQVPGTGTSRLALDEVVAVRDFLNEGGKLFYTGKNAGRQYAEGFEFRNTGFPQPNEDQQGRWCSADLTEARDHCITHTDDFLQYYLGAYIYVGGNPIDPETGKPFPMVGDADPFGPLAWDFDPAGNQDYGATFVVTSSILDPAAVPDVRVIGAPGHVDPAGGGAVRAARGLVLHGRQPHRRGVQAAAPDDRPHRRVQRQAGVLDVVRPRGRLRLHVRGGAHGRAGRLDDARGRERPHVAGRGPELPDDRRRVGLAVAAPVPRALPDGHRRWRHLRPDRDVRCVERGHRQLRRLAEVERGPVAVRRQAGRGLDHGRQRPGRPGPRFLGRRDRGVRERCEHGGDVVRGRPRRLGRRPAAGGHGEAGERLGAHRRAARRGWPRRHGRHRLRRLRLRGHRGRDRPQRRHERRPRVPGGALAVRR